MRRLQPLFFVGAPDELERKRQIAEELFRQTASQINLAER